MVHAFQRNNKLHSINMDTINEGIKKKMYGCFIQDIAMAYVANFSITAPEEEAKPPSDIF